MLGAALDVVTVVFWRRGLERTEKSPTLTKRAWGTRKSQTLRPRPAVKSLQIIFNWFQNRFSIYFCFPLATVRRLEPSRQSLRSFAGIATSTANGDIIYFLKRPVIIEVLDGCSGGAHRMWALRHQNTAIDANFVSCSNLPLVLLRNTVLVGHGSRSSASKCAGLRPF